MPTTDTQEVHSTWLEAFLSDEQFWPVEPTTLAETGLAPALVESLIFKHLAVAGNASGRRIAEKVCLPFRVLDDLFATLRTQQLIVHTGAAPFNDFYYNLTEPRAAASPSRARGLRLQRTRAGAVDGLHNFRRSAVH